MEFHGRAQQRECSLLGTRGVNDLTTEYRFQTTMVVAVLTVSINRDFNVPTRLARRQAIEPRRTQLHHELNTVARVVTRCYVTKKFELTARVEPQFKSLPGPARSTCPMMGSERLQRSIHPLEDVSQRCVSLLSQGSEDSFQAGSFRQRHILSHADSLSVTLQTELSCTLI